MMAFVAGIVALFVIIKLWFSSRVDLSLKIILSILLILTFSLRAFFPIISNILNLFCIIIIVIILIWKGEKIR